MSISKKIIEGNNQPSEGNAVVGGGGARALNPSEFIDPNHVLSVDASGQLITDINNSLDTRLFRGKGLVGLYPNSVAAYSLRSLRGVNGGQYVVRLRRVSDNEEKDFSEADLTGSVEGAELVTNGGFDTDTDWIKSNNWTITGGQAVSDGTVNFGSVKQNGVISSEAGIYYKITFTIVACSDFEGAGTLIDSGSIKNFKAHWQITSTGTYSAIFKTTGTNANFSFYTSTGVTMTLDDVSCVPYTPSAAELWTLNDRNLSARRTNESAHVTTWYDQSFSQNNATQTTATNQPRLILAGITNTQDGLAAIDFDGVDNYLTSSAFDSNLAQPNTAFSVFSTNGVGGYFYDGLTSGNRHFIATADTADLQVNAGADIVAQDAWQANKQQLTTVKYNTTSSEIYSRGILYDYGNLGTNSLDGITFGSTYNQTNYFDGNVQEFILYNSDQSVNLSAIQNEMNTHYSIYYDWETNLVGGTNAPTATAAYSLRSINGNAAQNVVRLRRAIDSAESDFTAADIVAGTEGSELLSNGDFSSGLTGWTADSNWTESGGQAVSDGSVSFGRLYQDNIVSSDAGVYYKVTLEVSSVTNFTSVGFNIGSSIKLITLQNSGITSAGTYTAIFKTIGNGSRFGFYTGPAHTMTIDNVSVKEYTPSALELWAMNSRDEMSSQLYQTAYVTTWYDQSASNKQVFDDPTITDTGNWTDNVGEVSVSQGNIYLGPATSPASESEYTQLVPAGSYTVEVDYENSVKVGASGFIIQIQNGVAGTGTVYIDEGSGTQVANFVVSSPGKFKIRTGGGINGQEINITGVRITDIGNLATQSTAASQPLLIRAGVTNTLNGKAALDFDGVDDYLENQGIQATQPTTFFGALQLSDDARFYSGTDGTNRQLTYINSSDVLALFAGSFVNTGANVSADFGQQKLITSRFNGADSSIHLNGDDYDTGDCGVGNLDGLYIGTNYTITGWYDGGIQELILYDSDQSVKRVNIEKNINRYYSIWYEYGTALIGGPTSPTPAAAYSLRGLNDDSSTTVVRLRRASDNAEKDFTAAEVVAGTAGAEYIPNTDFSTTDDWEFSGGWSITGGQLVFDGSGAGFATPQNLNGSYVDGDYYILSFDIVSQTGTNNRINVFGGNRTYPQLQIPTSGAQSISLVARYGGTGHLGFWSPTGDTVTYDNFSVKPYTPSAAELWAFENYGGIYTRQTSDSAYVTTLYDQTASNNQVFGDPTIQSPGDWTDSGPFIDISEGLISVENAFSGFFATYNGGDIQPGTYRLEVDYYGVTQANRIAVEGVVLPMGSGTKSETITVASSNTLQVTSNGGLTGQTGYITGIRLIDLGNPATQSTAAAQPKLITAGVTELENGKPAMVFDGVDDYLVASSANIGATMSFFLAGAEKTVGGIDPFFGDDVRFYNSHASVASGNSLFYAGTVANVWGDNGGVVQNLYSGLLSGGYGEGWRNGVQKMTSTAIGSDTITDLMLGWDTTVNYGEINLQEFIIYPSDQSANRYNIERNINKFYSIYYDSNTPLVGGQNAPTSAAAYSLRALDGYTDQTNVVRLRRASDNAESDFTAADLAGGVEGSELVTNGGFDTDSDWNKGTGWTISGGQASLDGTQTSYSALEQTGVMSEGVYVLSFDVTSNNYGQLYFQWSSNAVQLSAIEITSDGSYKLYVDTRGSLNQSWKFKFYSATNGNTATLDNVSLKEYTPTTAELWAIQSATAAGVQFGKQTTDSAYATTWYDQSGSGNDAAQATAAAQPLLVRAGVTNTENGKAALSFDGSDDWFDLRTVQFSATVDELSAFTVTATNNLSTGQIGLVASSLNRFYVPRLQGDGNLRASYSGDGSLNDGVYDTSQHLVSLVCDQANSVVRAFNDGAAFSVTPTNVIRTGVTNNSNNAIGAFGEHSARWDGSIQEVIIYPSDQSANRTNIETNINNHYNIY